MKLTWVCWLLLLLTGCTRPPEETRPDVTYHDLKYRVSGTTNWRYGPPFTTGQFDLALTVNIRSPLDSLVPYGLLVSQLASAEVYWDGVFLGTNGVVGENQASEMPGQLDYIYYLPPSVLSPGEHQVRMQVSNFHAGGKVRYYGMYIDEYLGPVLRPVIVTSGLHVYAGMFLVIGLFFGFRFLASRKDYSLLCFSLICLAFFALLIMEYIRSYYLYPYPWHFTRLRIILGLSWLISGMLPIFFTLRFGLRFHWGAVGWLAGIFLVLSLNTQYGYDPPTNWGMIAGFLLSAGVCLQAIRRQRTGAWLALFGVLPVALALPIFYAHYDVILYLGFGHLVIIVLISLALRERRQRALQQETLLRSGRLKLQLLKKSIQPHFLMNSITSAIDWIEAYPARGVDLLLALSEEFKILLDSADEKLIPLSQELALCHAHLKVMGFRKLTRYHLQTQLIDNGVSIPPAIILTLVENGISHYSVEKNSPEALHFYLEQGTVGEQWVYRFLTPGAATWPTTPPTKGTGLQYIEARLQESYGDAWELEYGPIAQGWETKIWVPQESQFV